jgi:glycosyltransferase involved in cell wall biosynthesis
VRNCEPNRLKSFATAARNFFVRLRRDLHRNVSAFYTHSEFARQRMIEKGFPLSRVRVVPPMIERPKRPAEHAPGRYVAFAGPLRSEWGVQTLLTAARACPGMPFLATGPDDRLRDLDGSLPANFTLAGALSENALEAYYANARFTVIPSIRYENSPSAILETMLAAKPVICARIGGLPEIVEDGLTGLLFEPGDAQDLASKIALLWENPEWCRRLGEAGRAKALQDYTPERHYERLMDVYCAAAEVQCESPAQWTPEGIMGGI